MKAFDLLISPKRRYVQTTMSKHHLRKYPNIEGTGIGLHLVKKIVENNGGKITVKSKMGKGSEFIVILKPHVK